LPFTIARLANVYGPGQRADLKGGVIAIFTRKLLARQAVTIYGDGAQSRDFVHIEDGVRALLLLGSIRASDTWNVGAGVATTVRRLLTMLERVIAPAVAVSYQPARRGDLQQSRLLVGKLRALGSAPFISLDDGLRTLAASAPSPAYRSAAPPDVS
jgi:UDP-glucose 4-epimerase